MVYLAALAAIALSGAIWYFLLKRPGWIIASYLVAVPVLPPLPLGTIELTALDFLTVPATLYIIYNLSGHNWRIFGLWSSGVFLFVVAAILSFVSFTIQQSLFSAPLFFRLIRLIEIFLAVLLASQIAGRLKKENIILLFLVGSATAAATAIVMFLAGVSLRQSQTFASMGEFIFRAAGTHGDSGSFGNLMGGAILVALWALIYISRRFRRLIWLAAAGGLISLVALGLTLSRGGIVLLVLGAVILLAPMIKKPGRFLKVALTALMVILLLTGILWTQIENRLVSESLTALGDRLSSFAELGDSLDHASSYRTTFWNRGWELFRNHPLAWPFGLGYKSLRLYYDLPLDNNFLQALFEMGLFGTAALILLIIFGFKSAWNLLRRNLAAGVLVAALWVGLISNMVTADVLTYWHNIPAFFILMIVMSSSSPSRETLTDAN